MSALARFRSWLRAMTRRPALEQEMHAELRFHIEAYAEDLMCGGMSREEAMRRARMELGGVEAQKEAMRASLGLRLWDEPWADLRYAVRMLRKSPGFTAIAVGSLALGIGANTTIFTVAKQVLLDRLNVPHPQDLRLFAWKSGEKPVVHSSWGQWDRLPSGQTTSTSFSYPVFQQLRRENHALEDLFAFKDAGRMTATVDGQAEVVQSEMVSGNYYQQLGVRTQLGRPIQPSDVVAPSSGAVVVISDGYWARRFGRSPNVIGKTIELNLIPVSIVGVNQPRFTGAKGAQSSPEVFLPFSMQPVILPKGKDSLLSDTKLWWVLIMGRIKPGVPEQSARVSLDVALNAAVRATMTIGKGEEIPHLILSDGSRGMNYTARQFAQPVYVLMSLVGLVLMLACANIANLLLARSAARQREMSVRLALGAGRWRILRQVLTESLLLSGLGGIAGFGLGYLGRNAIPRLLSNSWESTTFDGRFDWRVFAFTAGITLLTGLLFGIAPAWQATRTQVNSGLKDAALTITHRRKGYAGKAIVVFQVALSTLLVVGAGLFLRTLVNLVSVDPGFRPQHILLFDMQPPRTRYPAPKDVALHRRLEEELASVPGVDSVALSAVTLVANGTSTVDFLPSGQSRNSAKEQSVYINPVSERFFTTMSIPILAGRGFGESDTETSLKVAIVNRRLVRQFFPNTDPIGKTFDSNHQKFQVIGICADAKYDSLRHEVPPTFYPLYRQLLDAEYGMTYEIHTQMKPESIIPSLRKAIQSVDKDLPLIDVRTQEEQIDATMQQERIFANLSAGFGVLALTLACIGIYGVMAYTVARRINEIGIRMALGAQARQVLLMILRESSWLAIIGVAAGLGAALFLTRFLKAMLYGLQPNDPVTLIGAALLLFMVAILAGWGPAQRASRVEPMQALRHE